MRLVTGSKGFIASHYLEENPDCIGWDTKVDEPLPANVDSVIHLGALVSAPESIKEPKKYWENNVEFTTYLSRLYKWAPFFFASSCAVYKPLNPYALTKCAAEELLKDRPSTTIGRFFNVFGERDTKSVIYHFIKAALTGEDLVIYGDGRQTRDFIYVKDLINNINFTGETYDIGSGVGNNITDLAHEIIRLTDSKSDILYKMKRPGDPHDGGRSSNQKTTLKYGLHVGFERTVRWVESTL